MWVVLLIILIYLVVIFFQIDVDVIDIAMIISMIDGSEIISVNFESILILFTNFF